MESRDSPPDGALRRMGADTPLTPRSHSHTVRGGGLLALEAHDLAPAEWYGASMGERPHNETLPAAPELNSQVVSSALANASYPRDDSAEPCTETCVNALVTIHVEP